MRTRIGQFEVVRMLGRGGMAEVYLARDTQLGRKVALKLIRNRSVGRLRFFKEAQSTARFNHPNIVTIYAFGEYQGQPYQVLELLHGQTLRERLKEGTLHLQDKLRIAKDIAAAMAEAHRHGILHLDLKPENVIKLHDGRTKVLDFGLAQPIEAQLSIDTHDLEPGAFEETLDPHAQGTPNYMAPEQWTGRRLSSATDVWAFGVILYEMIQGQWPWTNTSKQVVNLAQEICSGPAVSFSKVESPAPSIHELVERCLARAPRDRPSADEIVLALSETIDGQRSNQNAPDNPFRGLRAFTAKDASLFFGRTQEINDIVERLRTEPLLAVVGVSGAGKSSLVQAGVTPRLIDAGWTVITIRPGTTPFKTLAIQILQTLHSASSGSWDTLPFNIEDAVTLAEELRRHPHRLSLMLDQLTVERGKHVLIIDQCEELYTMTGDSELQQAFMQAVALAADDPMDPVRVLITVRGDFLSRMAEASWETRQVLRRIMLLQVPGRTTLIETLVGPVTQIGYGFESGLPERMVDDAGKEAAPLPLLQFTAQWLWEERDESAHALTMAAYDRIGGVSGALIRHGDHVLDALDGEDVLVARDLLLRMVTAEHTRRIVRIDEITEGLSDYATRILDALIAARLVTTMRLHTPDGVHSVVELAHESLIRNWRRLNDWLEAQQDELRFLHEAREAAELWERRGRSSDEVWSGDALAEANLMLARFTSPVPSLVKAFIEAGRTRHHRRRRRIQGLVATAFTVLLAGSGALYVQRTQAIHERNRSEVHRKQAEKSAVGARNASHIASALVHRSDPTLVLALLREMDPRGTLPTKWRQLARWATFQTIAKVVIPHPSVAYWAEFSPEGTHIVTGAADGFVRLYPADGTGAPVLFRGHEGEINSVKFSADGKRMISASADRTARIWTRDGTTPSIVLKGHEGSVQDADFSPDGTLVVTASWDKTVRVWKADGSGPPTILHGASHLYCVTFHPDGTRVIAGDQSGRYWIWTLDGAEPSVWFEGSGSVSASAVFSPDGELAATASRDGTFQLHRSDDSKLPRLIQGHPEFISSLAFSPDARRLVTSSSDKTVRIWRLADMRNELVLRGHRGMVHSVSYSPDGRTIVTASGDQTVRVWKAEPTNTPISLAGHKKTVKGAGFDPRGNRVVTVSDDGEVRIWNADGSGLITTFQGHAGSTETAAFSPDGNKVVTTGADKTMRIWKVDESEPPVIIRNDTERYDGVTFSPDGNHVLSVSRSGARLWNVDGSGSPRVFRHDDIPWMGYGAFHPDGTQIALSGPNASLWNMDDPTSPLMLRGHRHYARTLVFSPNGTRLLTCSYDLTARLWDLTRRDSDGQIPSVELRGHTFAPHTGDSGGQGGFSPDGTRVLTISGDRTLRIWDVEGTKEPIILEIPSISIDFARIASFNADGTRILTASHEVRNPITGQKEHGAMIWPAFEDFTGLDDPALWRPTQYCPSVDFRMEFLGLSKKEALRRMAICQARVAVFRKGEAPSPSL